eukprot:6038248-Pleurochrysis_carterae.AAC.1
MPFGIALGRSRSQTLPGTSAATRQDQLQGNVRYAARVPYVFNTYLLSPSIVARQARLGGGAAARRRGCRVRGGEARALFSTCACYAAANEAIWRGKLCGAVTLLQRGALQFDRWNYCAAGDIVVHIILKRVASTATTCGALG